MSTFVSLYSGAGGLDAGFVAEGFEPLWANDVDVAAVATYRANVGTHAIAGDVDDARRGLAGLQPDVVIGGPPCQGFSVAGHLRAEDPRSRHVWGFMDVVERLRPAAFAMENVKALAVNRRWRSVIEGLQERARAAEYDVAVWVLDSSHYGVPQARTRMFMVGVRGKAPPPPLTSTAMHPLTIRKAPSTLPAVGEPGNDSICAARVVAARNPVMRRSPYAGMLFNGKGRALNLDAPASTLPATMGGNRTPIIDQKHLEGRTKKNWIVGYHARLSGGGAPVAAVPTRMRRLTVEEAAVLQGFPRDWLFSGSQASRYKQIGNAVPPPLAAAVARQVKAAIA